MNFTIKQEKKNFTIKYAGAPGLPGSKGDSAYLVWLSKGNSGTEQDFLDSLKGNNGYDGASSNIQVGTTTTLESGQNASVTNSGTALNPILNFSIPKGDKGDDGASSQLENIGTGIGVWKETLNEIAKLKSIVSENPVILISENENQDEIVFGIDGRELNTLIGYSLESIQLQIDTINENLLGFSTDFTTLFNDIDSINTAISDLSTIRNNITTLQNNVSTNTTDISNLTSRVTTAENNITTNTTNISNLTSRVTTAENNITTNTTNISNNTNAINSINTAISDLSTIRNNITTLQNNVSINTTNISNNTNAINTLNNTVSTNTTNISNNTNAISGLNSKVLPVGGTAGQVLSKIDGTNYNTQWVTPSSGSSAFNFNNYTRLKRYFPYASGQNPSLGLVMDGYSNASSNYDFNFSNCINPSGLTGKNYYYNYPKRSYKDSTATGTGSAGYIAGLILFSSFNMLRYGELMIKVGLRTANDTSIAQFVGITTATNLPSQIGNILGNANGTFIGFGFSATDSQYQLIYSSSSYIYKVPLSSFTGNFTASDIQARIIETPFSFQITPREDGLGFKASFYNHKTKTSGYYDFLYSQINQTYMFSDTALFSPLWGSFHASGFSGVKDVFDLFALNEMS